MHTVWLFISLVFGASSLSKFTAARRYYRTDVIDSGLSRCIYKDAELKLGRVRKKGMYLWLLG